MELDHKEKVMKKRHSRAKNAKKRNKKNMKEIRKTGKVPFGGDIEI